MSPATERRGLQLAVALGGCVPVFAGAAGVLLGPGMTGDGGSAALDSHMRYLSGLLLGIGLVFWWLIPRIEKPTPLVPILTLIVFIGGLARLGGIVVHGMPPGAMLFGLAVELVITPLICLWQHRIATRKV